jgi:hypothetical protein
MQRESASAGIALPPSGIGVRFVLAFAECRTLGSVGHLLLPNSATTRARALGLDAFAGCASWVGLLLVLAHA